ncbi:MAG: AbgT family transporter [Defluviitaleaceae bacterium]|nr:AbgT family transporter [Defluviitaleaceae bacterium]
MEEKSKSGFFIKWLNGLEKVGNKLPHPFMLFFYFTLTVILATALLSLLGVGTYHPATGERIEVLNLLSGEGIHRIFSTVLPNFTNFAPLGQVLVIMFAIGLLDRLGLLANILKSIVLAVPKRFITPMLVFVSVLSSVATDAGYVVLIPLGAALFASMKRHPIAGLAASFAGVAGGFGANLVITPGDALLGGISEAAAHAIDPTYTFNILGNWYFMIASVILLTLVGTFVTEKIVEPRLGEYKGTADLSEIDERVSPEEKRAMKGAGVAFLITAILLSLLIVPSWGPLRGEAEIVASPFFTHLIVVLFFLFLVPGIVYGKMTKQIKSNDDIAKNFIETMSTMSGFVALAFMAGQFVGLFAQSNLGAIIAIAGGNFLQEIGFTGFGLILSFVILSAFVNLFIGSASAQWLIFAPIFVPMLMQLGYSPEFTQLAYRVGDSITNPISPLLTYFALIIVFAQKYDKKAGMGTIISTMVPYSIFFGIFWVALLGIWMIFALPIGPGAMIFLP